MCLGKKSRQSNPFLTEPYDRKVKKKKCTNVLILLLELQALEFPGTPLTLSNAGFSQKIQKQDRKGFRTLSTIEGAKKSF